jgi:hypothetical protein
MNHNQIPDHWIPTEASLFDKQFNADKLVFLIGGFDLIDYDAPA